MKELYRYVLFTFLLIFSQPSFANWGLTDDQPIEISAQAKNIEADIHALPEQHFFPITITLK